MKWWLDRPYPALEEAELRLAMSFGIGLVCFLTLNIFKPFGLHEVTDVSFFAGFGATATLSLLIHFFVIPQIVPQWFNPDHWTVRHQLLLIVSIVLLISVLNYFYNSTFGHDISPQYGLLPFIYMTTMVGVLPIIIMTYCTELIARNKNKSEARALSPSKKTEMQVLPITIRSDSSKDPDITIELNGFLYAESGNNYCEVHFVENNQVRKRLIRLNLKGLESQLHSFPNIIRCHKSYIVNKDKILSFDGNARSMTLRLVQGDYDIPVSRSLDRSLLS
jgi:hypothetical protein